MTSNQQFCLRWNNHQSTLISVFEALLESGTLVDCTLAAEGQYLRAHKVVLSACSPYLGMLLSQDFEKHPILILKDVKFQELKSMLDYMYRGEVNISQDQLGTFLKAAESLQIKGLTDSGNSNSNNNSNNSVNGGMGSDAGEDYNAARHRKHLAMMAEAHARAHSPSLMEQQNHHRWMNNGGSMNDMIRDGSVSPSPRKRKRPRRSSINGQRNPMLNGHDEIMPLQPLIQQQQAVNNNTNVLAQSLAAPPLMQLPKRSITPPPSQPIENNIKKETSPIRSESPKITNNENNNNVPYNKQNNSNQSSPVSNNNNSSNNNISNNDGNQTDDDVQSEVDSVATKRDDDEANIVGNAGEENNDDICEDDIEEDCVDDDNSNGGEGRGRQPPGPSTIANAHWMMTADSLPNSDCLQDSKEKVQEEVPKLNLVQQEKTSTLLEKIVSQVPQKPKPTTTLQLITSNQLMNNSSVAKSQVLDAQQLKNLFQTTSNVVGGNTQLKLINPLQLQNTRQIYLTNISRLITINNNNTINNNTGKLNIPTTRMPTALVITPQSVANVNNQNTATINNNNNNSNNNTSNEILSCNMCGKKYQWKQSLTRHIREHRCAKGPQHSCPCCSLSFKHTSSLNKHVMLCSAVHSRLHQVSIEGGDTVPNTSTDSATIRPIKENNDSDVTNVIKTEVDVGVVEDEDETSCDNNDAISDIDDDDDDEDVEEVNEEEVDKTDPLS